ncbi:chemotaxis protein CheB [Polaromonas sp. AER18D-145]|uniref:chemotaxis protein CheB n=1 Tax=Polaromonas sp. AER18D-145 TaxID=1977060 RepID=UPI000BBC4730|nr:chemotaxis protein CheB [Polaromonas sp. AER18D-145]
MSAPTTSAGHVAQAVVIGASAGGVQALMALLSDLPRSFQLPIVAVLHLSEDRPSQLADIFRHKLQRPVREADDKESIAPGTLYFASPGYHLSVEKDRTFSLSVEEPVHYSRPSIDVLMESAADAYGAGLVGILLTGANADGAAGLARIRQLGGLTIVQDPAEALAVTMPEAAIRTMPPDFILPLDGIRSLLHTLDRPAP